MVQRRHVVVAAIAGLATAIVSVVGGVWLAAALDDDPSFDGSFRLEEPGIFEQPLDEGNPDVSGEVMPDVDLLDSADRTVRLDRYRGAPTVVNVWFANCPPCQRELADFATVHAEVGDRVQFVGVDPFDSVEVMERFAAERGVSYDLLRDPERELAIALEIVAYPVTLFVDADGRILDQTGELDADELRSHIEHHWPDIVTAR